jgi:dipeptidyl-peptidase 4
MRSQVVTCIRAFCICAALASVLLIGTVATAATVDRFAEPDAVLAGKYRNLITDLDLSAKFVGDNKVLFRRGPRGAGEIVLADPVSGQSKVLVREADLKPKLITAGAKFTDTADMRPLDYDAATLKLFAAGMAWQVELASGTVKALPPPSREHNGEAVVSPDGKVRVVARDYNLHLVDVASGRERALTRDGSFDRRYGTNYPMLGDMAAANSENPPMPVAVQWSPDSRRILTYRLLRNNAYIWTGVQQTPPGERFPRHFSYVYPTAGAKDVPLVEPVVIDVGVPDAPAILNLKVPSLSLLWPGDPPLYWQDGRIFYEWTKRGYGEIDLYDVDANTGAAKLRVHEAVKPVVTVTSTSIRTAPEIGGYLVVSERSGWAQLYFVRNGENPSAGKALTHGAWEVAEVLHVAKEGSVLLSGIGREPGVNPYYRMLYRVTLSGKIKNLTPEPLDHQVTVSDDGKWVIDVMSSPVTPPRTVVRAAGDGHIVAELGRADPSRLLASGYPAPEPFETLADDGKTKLYGMIYRPMGFDPARKYPVIDYVYTGPTTHNVPESYAMTLRGPANILAQLGAVVVIIDGRGTSQRGHAFRLPAFQNMGEVGIDDHIRVMQAMKAKYPYLDLTRVGVFGHSAGGYDAARFILRRPDFFTAAIASSGNQDLRLDKAWWPEVSMGLADDATWERNSNVSVAANLKGKLMLIHGDIDDNVPIAATLALHKALVDASKLHELVIIPNRRHDTYTPYFWHTQFDFFLRNLIDAPPVP